MLLNKVATLSLLVLLFFLYSCASPQFSKIDISMPKDFEMINTEIKDKIPLRAGLYLKPDIRNYSKKGPIASFVTHTTFSMGDALSSGSERVLRNIFKDVVIIDQLESDLSTKNIDVIVTPELVGIYGQAKMIDGSKVPKAVNQLVMKWNIVSPDGKIIYVNTITGEGLQKLSFSFTSAGIAEDEKNNMLMLIKDQFQKAQEDIYSSGWWKKQWWKNSN